MAFRLRQPRPKAVAPIENILTDFVPVAASDEFADHPHASACSPTASYCTEFKSTPARAPSTRCLDAHKQTCIHKPVSTAPSRTGFALVLREPHGTRLPSQSKGCARSYRALCVTCATRQSKVCIGVASRKDSLDENRKSFDSYGTILKQTCDPRMEWRYSSHHSMQKLGIQRAFSCASFRVVCR